MPHRVHSDSAVNKRPGRMHPPRAREREKKKEKDTRASTSRPSWCDNGCLEINGWVSVGWWFIDMCFRDDSYSGGGSSYLGRSLS
jgi:hypothetical protein